MKPNNMLARLGIALAVLACAAASIAHVRAQDQPASVPDLLMEAFRLFQGNNPNSIGQAEATCGRVIGILQNITPLSETQLQQLLTAYELRGRARFQLRRESEAREDFRDVLQRSPSHEFGSLTRERGGGTLNPQSANVFDEVRRQYIGMVVFNITPEDADVQFRGVPLPRERRSGGRQVPAPVGTYTVSIARRMFATQEVPVVVDAAMPATVEVSLKRVKSQLDIITSVPGVEVTIDNVSYGKTLEAALPERYAKLSEVAALGSALGFLPVPDIATLTPRIKLKRECFLPEEFSITFDQPAERPVVRAMRSAAAPLEITGTPGALWIDGEDTKQSAPYKGTLCPKDEPREPRVVEVRNARGRDVRRIVPVPMQPNSFVADPKPAVAMLAQNGLPPGYTEDLRETLESRFLQTGIGGITFFSLNREVANREIKAEGVSAGWLGFDVDGRPLTEEARLSRQDTRQKIVSSLSRKLDVQGVAEILVPDFRTNQSVLLLTFLARDSGVPETIRIDLDEPRSVQAAVTYFNDRFRLTRVGSGLAVADVPGVTGAVVLYQSWKTTGEDSLSPGDVITSANGTKVADASAFEALVAGSKVGQAITLQIQRGKGNPGPSTVQLTPIERNQVVAFDDQTLPVNKRLLEFRLALEDAPPQSQGITRLNLAVVLMRVGSWALAKEQLDQVAMDDLKQGEDISRGTVQYHLGICLENLAKPEEAARAYRAAADSPGAWLTADGLLVKSFAELKLAALRGR